MDCDCFYFEEDRDQFVSGEPMVCTCDHMEDEHDDNGECQAEVDPV